MVGVRARVIWGFCVVGLALGSMHIAATTPEGTTPEFFKNNNSIEKNRTGPLTFAEIEELLLSSYGASDQAYIARPVDSDGMPLLTIQEQRHLVFSIFARLDKGKLNFPQDNYLHHAIGFLIGDLELFYNKGDSAHDNHIFSRVDCTNSLFGQAALAKMVATPLVHVGMLRDRQSLIRALCEDEQLFDRVENLVLTMKKSEPYILSFWVEQESSTRAMIDSLYWDIPSWDRNAKKLEIAARLQFLLTARPAIEDVFFNAGLIYIANTFFLEKITGGYNEKYNASLAKALAEAVFEVVPIKEVQNIVGLYKNNISIDSYCKEHNLRVDFNSLEDKNRWLHDSSVQSRALFHSGIKLLGKLYFATRRWESLKTVFNQTIQLRNTLNALQTRLIKVADFMQGFNELKELAVEHPFIERGLFSFETVKKLSTNSLGSADFRLLLKLLKTSTFKGEASFFSYSGRVLKTYKLLQKTKPELSEVLYVYGELDACLSIAKLVRKYQSERVGYCFVEYSDSRDPYLKLDGFWNPQVDPSVVVPNSLELGIPGKARNIVLTGSNTGGKSTLIKAMALDVLMAQTWGIAPAKNMVIAPFHYIGSSMNIVDNTAKGKSLYQMEVERATALVKAAHLCEFENKRCLLFIDELFRGTGPEAASQKTYNTAKDLASGANTIFVLATHFVTPSTSLEQETGGVCKNYKVEAYINEQGKIVRPFKLEEGINQSNIAGNIFDHALKQEYAH